MPTERTGLAERRPPDFELDGLWQALGRLDQILERATASADAAFAAGSATEPYRGLYITSDDAHRMLKRLPGEPYLAGQDDSREKGLPEASRFPWLQRQFDLDAFDLDVILVALAPRWICVTNVSMLICTTT
ncbi:MAG: hypothetical protein R2762_02860 [Bryobacteraceae bacterium]